MFGQEVVNSMDVSKPKSLAHSIEYLYDHLNITHPSELDMFYIADKFSLNIHLFPIQSRTFKKDSVYYIIIDSRYPQKQWQDFGHEIAHIFLHGWLPEIINYGGNQLFLTNQFIQYQEIKADLFSYEFCIPTFMLRKMEIPNHVQRAASYIAEQFCVTNEFAYKRLNRLKQNMIKSNIANIMGWEEII